MNETEGFTFLAILSIVLPGHERETNFEVVLTPTDSVSLSDGSTKLLQDCTLADLGHIAGEMEMELWSNFQDIPLIELAADSETEIRIIFPEDNLDGTAEFALWLEHLAIVEGRRLAAGELPQDGESIASITWVKERESSDSDEMIEKVLDDIFAEEDDLDDDSKIQETSSDDDSPASDTLEAALDEIDLEVAEPEPVHEEKTVDADAEPKTEISEPTEIRILGRRRPLNHPTWSAVDILMNEIAFREAQRHALSSLDREVAGVLIGPMPEKQPDGRYVVHITDTIIARHTKMHGASVTYTPESWRYINDKLSELYPEDSAVIVGWYHTHPGFGIFLSSMDRFIHQNFFIQKWHVALVLDPLATKSGFFCWDRKQELVESYEFPWPNWAPNSW